MKAKPIKTLRKIGTIEGISFLLLVGVAMPLKRIYGMPEAVTIVGWVHGVAFMLYCYYIWKCMLIAKWGFGRIATLFIASLLPFGPFFTHKGLKKDEEKLNLTES